MSSIKFIAIVFIIYCFYFNNCLAICSAKTVYNLNMPQCNKMCLSAGFPRFLMYLFACRCCYWNWKKLIKNLLLKIYSLKYKSFYI